MELINIGIKRNNAYFCEQYLLILFITVWTYVHLNKSLNQYLNSVHAFVNFIPFTSYTYISLRNICEKN